MVKIFLNNIEVLQTQAQSYKEIINGIVENIHLASNEFYLLQNGKRFSEGAVAFSNLHCYIRAFGGKGGFGSMLRAIGAQIEKTTNREACRDLSGRRLRDINEEKRLKAWLEKQADREREAEEKKKRKIEKLLAVPKHDFKDAEYEKARSKLTEKVNDAVEEGFKKSQQTKKNIEIDKPEPSTSKRKAETTNVKPKKKKTALWIGDDISDCDSDSSESDTEEVSSKLIEKVNDVVEKGLKKSQQAKENFEEDKPEPSTSKRKAETTNVKPKNKKSALWIGDISDYDSDSSESDTNSTEKPKAIKN